MNELIKCFSDIDDKFICAAIEREASFHRRGTIFTAVKAVGAVAAACLAVTFGINKLLEREQSRPPVVVEITASADETTAPIISEADETTPPIVSDNDETQPSYAAKMISDYKTADKVPASEDEINRFYPEEFPDYVIDCGGSRVTIGAASGGKRKTVLSADRVISLYAADLNGDGYRGICAVTRTNGRESVTAYDIMNDMTYFCAVSDRKIVHYELRITDGELYCDSFSADGEVLRSDKLDISLFSEDTLSKVIQRKIDASVAPVDAGVVTAPVETLLDYSTIYPQLDYELGVDYEKDAEYRLKAAADPEEFYKDIGEDGYNELREHHFMTERVIRWCDLAKTDDADYICLVEYGYGAQLGSYILPIYVKDGKVIRKDPVIEIHAISIESDERDVFIIGYDRILRIDLTTMEKETIAATGWSCIFGITDDYVLFGNGEDFIYDRSTGEVTKVPGLSATGMEQDITRIAGNTVEYTAGDYGYIYHIDTGETEETDDLYFGADNMIENERFVVKPTTMRMGYSRYDNRYLTVTDKISGTETTYDLGVLPERYYDKTQSNLSLYLMIDIIAGNKLIMTPLRLKPCVLDLETGEIMLISNETGANFNKLYMFERGGEWLYNINSLYGYDLSFGER